MQTRDWLNVRPNVMLQGRMATSNCSSTYEYAPAGHVITQFDGSLTLGLNIRLQAQCQIWRPDVMNWYPLGKVLTMVTVCRAASTC